MSQSSTPHPSPSATLAVAPLIDGQLVASASEAVFPVFNPATGAEIARYPEGSALDADRAVAAARRSFDAGVWRRRPAIERKKILFRWADLVQENAARLDALDAMEMGKPIGLPAFNAFLAGELLRFNAEASDKVFGVVLPGDSHSTVIRERAPRGVVAAIVPWNFPTYNCLLKLAPALAAGNSVVLKPSEVASQSAMLLGKLALEAGLPPGVLNVVPGQGETAGRPLAEHMDVDMLTFTGSSRVGRLMMQYAGASNMKVVSAECGGKSPHIVLDDGLDLDRVAGFIAQMIVMNQGQVCSIGSRVLVQDTMQEALVEKIGAALQTVVPGDPLEPTTTFGPLASRRQRDLVQAFVEDARADGARLVHGGQRLLEETGGYFFSPTLFSDVAPASALMQEEVFGPVLAVTSFKTIDEAIKLARGTPYGLAAYVWSAKFASGQQIASALQTAVTVLNTSEAGGAGPGFAFSGEPAGLSGVGVEGGVAGLESFTRLQTVWINHG